MEDQGRAMQGCLWALVLGLPLWLAIAALLVLLLR